MATAAAASAAAGAGRTTDALFPTLFGFNDIADGSAYDQADDGNDDKRRNETLASLRQQHDDTFSLPPVSSQSSFASWTVLTDPDEELPFK